MWPNHGNATGWCPILCLFEGLLLKILSLFFFFKAQDVAAHTKTSVKCKTAGHVTKIMLTDGRKEFYCAAVHKALEAYGITHLPAGLYTPEQNCEADQENRTTVVNACCMHHTSGLSKEFGAKT